MKTTPDIMTVYVSMGIIIAGVVLYGYQSHWITETNLMDFVGIVTLVIVTVAARYTISSYQIQREQRKEQIEADKPNIEVRVHPIDTITRNLIRISVVNNSQRPALIVAWYFFPMKGTPWSTKIQSGSSSGNVWTGGSLPRVFPIRLEAKEPFEFRVVLTDCDWLKMEEIGVRDNEDRLWKPTIEALNQFYFEAKRLSP